MSGPFEEPPRRGYRFPAGVPASVQESGASIPCSAENLSRSGVLLVGPIAKPDGDLLDFTLKTPTGTFELQLRGRIARFETDAASGESRVALAFADLDNAALDSVEIFLARLLEAPPSATLESVRPGAPPHEVKKVLEAVPLPERIALAQRAELRQREILRQDQHPAVLEALCRNANLTVIEARAVAASPFLQAGTIDLLARDPRFRMDEELRMTLATHARAPLSTAERLTSDLNAPQIKRLIARPGLNVALREKLVRKMTRG
jgi:hypothetical protein